MEKKACSNTHTSSIHKRTIELLPYQDFPICKLSRNEMSSDFKIPLHISINVRYVAIQDWCIRNTLYSIGPLLNIDSMFYSLILAVFIVEWYIVKCSWSIQKTRWQLLHPNLTGDMFWMMLLHYPKIKGTADLHTCWSTVQYVDRESNTLLYSSHTI